jgi:MFS family permease
MDSSSSDSSSTASDVPLWRNWNYQVLLAGSAVSGLGDQLYVFIIPWLTYTLSSSALAMTGIRAGEYLPNVVLGLVAGVLVDRWDRRRTLMIVSVAQCGILLAIAALFNGHRLAILDLWLLAFALNAVGFGAGLGFTSFIPQLVPKSQLTTANAQSAAVNTVVRMLGPALAGAIAATLGPGTGLGLDAVSFLTITLALLVIRTGVAPTRRSQQRMGDANREAARWLRSCRPLLFSTAAVASLNLFHSSVIPLVLFRARHDLYISSVDAGLVFTVGSVGTLISTAFVSRISRALGWQRTFLLAFPVLAIGALLLASARSVVGLAGGYGIDAVGVTFANVNYLSARQNLTPNELLGRVASLTSMIMKIPYPLGLVALGAVADKVSGAAAFGAIGVGLALTGIVCARSVLGTAPVSRAESSTTSL